MIEYQREFTFELFRHDLFLTKLVEIMIKLDNDALVICLRILALISEGNPLLFPKAIFMDNEMIKLTVVFNKIIEILKGLKEISI